MSTANAPATAAEQAALDRIQKCFDALDRISASLDQIAARRSDGEKQFLDSLLSGNFDGATVLNAWNGWKQQQAQLDDQKKALKEVTAIIDAFLGQQLQSRSPALRIVLQKEEARLKNQIGKSADQAAALQKRLDEINQWLQSLEEAPAKKSGAAAKA